MWRFTLCVALSLAVWHPADPASADDSSTIHGNIVQRSATPRFDVLFPRMRSRKRAGSNVLVSAGAAIGAGATKSLIAVQDLADVELLEYQAHLKTFITANGSLGSAGMPRPPGAPDGSPAAELPEHATYEVYAGSSAQESPCDSNAPHLLLDFDGDGTNDLLCWLSGAGRWTILFGSSPADRPCLRERFLSIGAPYDSDHTLVPLVGRFRSADHDSILFIRAPEGPWYLSDFLDEAGMPAVELSAGLRQSAISNYFGGFQINVADAPGAAISAYREGTAFTPKSIPADDVLRGNSVPKFLGEDLHLESLHSPQVCTGYLPTLRRWGSAGTFGCPLGYAILASVDADEIHGFSGLTCCPLPREDIFDSKVTFVPAGSPCPSDSVLTEILDREHDYLPCSGCAVCTRINTDRYELGSAKPGVYWGMGFSAAGGVRRIPRSKLPWSLRLAAGRTTDREKNNDGCVGDPFGSVLTGTPGYCATAGYRVIFEKHGGTRVPLKTLPDCRGIADQAVPGKAQCIP